jgi:single-strand DNA-binding protein
VAERTPSATSTDPGNRTAARAWYARRSRADVQLIGRVGGDPDVRFATEASGRAWARFAVATEAPERAEDVPDWHTVIARDRLAQFVARYVTRGRLVHVTGWLTYRTVEARQRAQPLAEIRASSVLLLDRPPRSDAPRAAP